MKMTSTQRHFDILIVGGGFAGIYCAKQVVKRLGYLDKSIGLVSESNHMVFQPMLAEVVGGSLSPRHVVNPVRLLVPGVDVLKGRVVGLDLEGKEIHVDGGPFAPNIKLTFNHLMLSPGAEVDVSRFPGMAEHAFLMRNCGDAMKLRSTIISRMEEANLVDDPELRKRLLAFVVVGGGYSGVETAGQIADLLGSVCHHYEFIQEDEPTVTLVHSRDCLLPTLDRSLGHYTKRQLEKMGVKVLLETRVRAVTASSVQLGDGNRIDARTVVCTIGNAPNPLLAQLADDGSVTMERGKLVVEPTGRVKGHTNLWSGGDCAVFPKADGGNCPETAQFAMRQGQSVGENIARAVFETPLEDFTFTGLGELASIGHRTAVANIGGVNFSGFVAWFMWRTIYLMKLPGLDRKLRVMSEWTFDLFFPRDINLLTPEYSSPLEEMHLTEGDYVFRSGEPAFSLYAVSSGEIQITDSEGRVVKTAGPGDHFGERALLDDRIWRFDAKATTATTLVAIGARTFEKIVGSMGQIGSVFRRSAESYQSAEEMEQTLACIPDEVRQQTAGDVMTRDVTTVASTATIQEALETFKTEHHSAYPVVNEDGQVLGLLRRSLMYEWLQTHGMEQGLSVCEVPLTQAHRTPLDRPVPALMEELIRAGVAKAVVIDGDGRLQGMLTLVDLMGGNPAGSCKVVAEKAEAAEVAS
jgi:NADH dehydrogenase